MKSLWHRFVGPLTPGVRVIVAILVLMGLAVIIGGYSRAYDLYPWLSLSGAGFWKGRLWTILTYGLLPAGIWDFLFNWIVILFLGVWLERIWSRGELWLCCLFALLAAGLAKVIIQPSDPLLMVGTMPVVFGLLAAWGRLFAYEKILFWFIWEMTVRQAAILMTVIGFIIMLPCAGVVNAGIMLCGAPAGLLYVWLRGKITHARASRTVTSERMGRLEL
ncbi:MAG: rhomboid family intramembrane serine protease [Verrucomicrobia bacterium]|nr:rhomboid family intramembrane serine protease [Verrucomicrobiota bacterium]